MSIKVTIGESKTQKEKPFPKLMISHHKRFVTIVHFKEPSIGTQIYSTNPTNYPFQMKESDGWRMDLFTDYNEPITLQND